MEFSFETVYNQKAVTAMAKALRKTIRNKRSRRSHIWGWIVVAVAILLTLPFGNENYVIDAGTVATWLVALVIILVFFFEDRLNAYIARKRMLAGTGKAISIFNEDGYSSESEMGRTEWHYKNIVAIAETNDYFVFIFDKSHAQVYDKNSLSGGTVDEFREFITAITEKEIKHIK